MTVARTERPHEAQPYKMRKRLTGKPRLIDTSAHASILKIQRLSDCDLKFCIFQAF